MFPFDFGFIAVIVLIVLLLVLLISHQLKGETDTMMTIVWTGAIILFGIVEAVTAGLVCIWFVAGALVALMLMGGSVDALGKFYEEWGNPALKDHYLFYVFFCAFLYAAILCAMKKERVTRWDALFGILVGIPNYLCSRFLLLSLADLPAVVVYPTFSVGTIICITLIGVFFFRERLLRRQTAAMGIIFVALALLNM